MAKVRKKGDKFYVDYRRSGVRARPMFQSRREAEDFKRRLLMGDGAIVSTSKTLRECIEDYKANFTSLKDSKKNEETYFKTFLSFMSRHKVIYPRQIELIHLQKLQRDLRESVSGSTVNRQFNTFKHFINQCELWGHLPKSPLKGLARMKEQPTKKRLWTTSEFVTFFETLKEPWQKDIAFLVARTGMRPSDVVRLRWRDIDFTRASISIVTIKGNGDSKTREMLLPTEIVNYLRSIKKRKGRVATPYVITNSNHKPVTSNAVKVAMARTIARAGLDGLQFYGIKHTLASKLRGQGTDTETIRQILGHTNLSTTQKYLQNLTGNDLVRDALKGVFIENPKLV